MTDFWRHPVVPRLKAELDALRAVGARHQVSGIVHLAGYPAPGGTAGGTASTQGLLDGILNIARVAQERGVRRAGLASTTGVYDGIETGSPLTEDLPAHLTAPHPIPRWKKISELSGGQLAEAADVEIVSLRISGTVPEADPELPAGTGRPGSAFDITRVHDDTGFEPEYDRAHAAAGYISWLRAGNER